MNPVWQYPPQVRIIPSEPVPDRLFVYMARIKPEVAAVLRSAFESGNSLSGDLNSLHNEHLLYTYHLGERGLIWEAGPAADFTRILFIYSTGDLEEAQGLMRGDPFYRSGIFSDDRCFEWAIHTPFWRTNLAHRRLIEQLMKENGLLPVHPPGIIPPITGINVEVVTPPKLFVSLARTKVEYVQPQPDKPMPAFLLYHVLHRLAPGGTSQTGYDWEGGPSLDYLYDLSILSVNSMETARYIRENDPFSLQGIFYDFEDFEWQILMPYKKASPACKEVLKRLLKEAGAILPE